MRVIALVLLGAGCSAQPSARPTAPCFSLDTLRTGLTFGEIPTDDTDIIAYAINTDPSGHMVAGVMEGRGMMVPPRRADSLIYDPVTGVMRIAYQRNGAWRTLTFKPACDTLRGRLDFRDSQNREVSETKVYPRLGGRP